MVGVSEREFLHTTDVNGASAIQKEAGVPHNGNSDVHCFPPENR